MVIYTSTGIVTSYVFNDFNSLVILVINQNVYPPSSIYCYFKFYSMLSNFIFIEKILRNNLSRPWRQTVHIVFVIFRNCCVWCWIRVEILPTCLGVSHWVGVIGKHLATASNEYRRRTNYDRRQNAESEARDFHMRIMWPNRYSAVVLRLIPKSWLRV